MYKDELSSEELWIPHSKFTQYVRKFYMMSINEYFDRVMELRGETNAGKCLICGGQTKWDCMAEGYKDTCSVNCRNKLQSMGNDKLLIVTKTGLITHSTNFEYITKYIIDPDKKSEISNELNLYSLLNEIDDLGGVWVAGYNPKSLKYAPKKVRELVTKKSTLW